MNKRNFIKTLATLAATFTLKPEISANEKIDFTVSATKNCLIPVSDKTMELNVYGEYVCLVSRVVLHARMLEDSTYFNFTSEPFLERYLTDQDFSTMKKLIENYLAEHKAKGTPISQCAPVIRFASWK